MSERLYPEHGNSPERLRIKSDGGGIPRHGQATVRGPEANVGDLAGIAENSVGERDTECQRCRFLTLKADMYREMSQEFAVEMVNLKRKLIELEEAKP